ncbi:hypothetical protein CCACVL1_16313 [Corchorus capsularis]|uniref:Uncharacterized protein n=1 Tax=Corchorus capsularis TaxID=210143 RepID=A0A1R3HXR4_COCAP|nr:hypothetical protein CCACVL1_16313 [Corchorus capsularis]
MNGYSKIKAVGNIEDFRSMECYSSSDLMPVNIPDQTPNPKPISNNTIITTPIPNPSDHKKQEETNQIIMIKNNSSATQDSSSEQEDHDHHQEGNNNNINNGEMFGPRLKRNSSVSSAYAVQAAVKRAFSMRRSSSVSERYCRIHDQSVTLSSPFDDEELYTNGIRRSVKKKNSSGKILKAWKKLFGL